MLRRSTARVDRALPAYHPRPVVLPTPASYVDRNGAIVIVGYNDMREILSRLNAVFVRSHPDFRFNLSLKGTATAAPALTFGVSAFAPMGAEFSSIEMESYEAIVGHQPGAIRVAHAPATPGALSGPVHVFVNKKNPLRKLTTVQVARIFAAGYPGGALTHWGQVGLTGAWADRAIHPFGIGDEAVAGGGPFMVQHWFQGHSFVLNGQTSAGTAENVRRVSVDPLAIGMGTDNVLRHRVRSVAIGGADGGFCSIGANADILAGRYPFDRHLLIYIRRPPDPFVAEYLRMVLSRDGQQCIAKAPPGYLPLTACEAEREREKLK